MNSAGYSCNPTGRPGGLEIKTTGNSIDIKYFSGEIEIFNDFALHRVYIDTLQANAAAGHKLIPERSPAIHFINIIGQDIDQFIEPFAAGRSPGFILSKVGFLK